MRFALELDRGTESRDRLTEKFERYLLIASGPDAPEVVLFCFPSTEREQSARKVLQHQGLPVATTSLQRQLSDPLAPCGARSERTRGCGSSTSALGQFMSDGVAAAFIGATASVIGSVLTYLVGIRSLRRSMSTSNGGTARTAP